MFSLFISLYSLFVCSQSVKTITAYVYADNYFQFYFNGQLIETDPVSYVPHNGMAFDFEAPDEGLYTFAFLAKDYSNSEGLEINSQTGEECIGDGGLIARFSDGTVTNSNWKCKVINYGPTNINPCYSTASQPPKCLTLGTQRSTTCLLSSESEPTGWYEPGFDDSTWTAATEYTEADIGWGKAPSNQDADYSGCINPRDLDFGTSASFIWGSSLYYDNTILCRYQKTESVSNTLDTMSIPTTSGNCADPTDSTTTTTTTTTTAGGGGTTTSSTSTTSNTGTTKDTPPPPPDSTSTTTSGSSGTGDSTTTTTTTSITSTTLGDGQTTTDTNTGSNTSTTRTSNANGKKGYQNMQGFIVISVTSLAVSMVGL